MGQSERMAAADPRAYAALCVGRDLDGACFQRRLGDPQLAPWRITLPVVRMDALNPHTVWTWNAIAKRRGAWALDDHAPEATKSQL